LGGDAHYCIRAAFAGRQRVEAFEVFGVYAQNITFLRLVRPDFGRRHAAFLEVNLLKIESGAASGIVHDFREGIGQSARADVVDGQNGVILAKLPATVDDSQRAPLDFRVASLDRIEIEFGRVAAHAHAGCGTAAHADAHARPA